MAEKHHHHHLFHHHKNEEKPVDTVDVVYSETTFDAAGAEVDYKKEEKHHKHMEHLGEIGVAAAGAYALEQLALTSNVGESVNVESTPNETQSLFPDQSDATKRKLTSDVWNHFKRQNIDGKWKAVCNYCGSKLLGETKQGTSHLRTHFSSCKLRKTRDIRQAVLKTERKGSETVLVGSYAFNQDVSRQQLAKMIILHEYPLSIVEHIGFKGFCNSLQPLFKGVSRNTIKSDIMKLYSVEKQNMMKLLSKNQSRIAITTDMWTASQQNKGYMTVTAHFVDDSWTLESRLLRFIYVPAPHSSKILAEVLIECMMDWNLDIKLSTLTVDNCSTNDAMIERILEKISPRSLILGGKLFHMRCCAHIVNLIVKDGLSIISNAIEKIRESVNFWTATPKREEKFIDTCGQVNITYGRKLVLDCKTRWNSTFLMLQVATTYKDVFERLAQRDHLYKTVPNEDDWKMATEICNKLELFYDVTKLFSGTLYPTANVYFTKVCEIKLALMEWVHIPDLIIRELATSMMTKFDKYWSVINGVMAVGIILDPRYKDTLFDYFFAEIYGDKADEKMEDVMSICQEMVRDYDIKIKGKDSDSSSSRINQSQDVGGGKVASWRSHHERKLSAQKTATRGQRSELDRYLEEPMLPDSTEVFDVLGWWKLNGLKYPILQMIARDFLAIPISTVASESSFSTSGRFLTPHRSRLRPDTLEALMCLQDWLWADVKGSSKSKVDIDECITVLEDMDVDIE